jgi:phenylalanyl-tRNA synthetase beta chain
LDTLFKDLGIKTVHYKDSETVGLGADIYIGKEYLGTIEVLEKHMIDFELNFEKILSHVSLKKVYTPISKFPPIIEDIRVELTENITFKQISDLIISQNPLIKQVELLDIYENKKTFRILYQSNEKNLTNEDVTPIREKVIKSLEKELHAKFI